MQAPDSAVCGKTRGFRQGTAVPQMARIEKRLQPLRAHPGFFPQPLWSGEHAPLALLALSAWAKGGQPKAQGVRNVQPHFFVSFFLFELAR